LSNSDFVVCPNLTIADRNVSVYKLDNGNTGVLEISYKTQFYDIGTNIVNDGNVTILACSNSIGECPECVLANYSNTSDPLTINCTLLNCVCQNYTQLVSYMANIGDGFSGFNTTEYALIDLDSGPYIPYIGNPTPFGTVIPMKKRTVTVFVSFEQPIVTVTPSSPVEIHVWVSVLSQNKMITCNATCSFAINEAWLITPEELWVTVYQDDIEIYEKSFQTTAVSFCPIPSNPFSSVWVQSWNCMGATGRFLFIAAIIGFIVVVITLIMLTYKFGKCWWDSYINRQQVSLTINNNDSDDYEMSNLDKLKQFVNSGRRGKVNSEGGIVPFSNYTIAIICICLLISPTSAATCGKSVLAQSIVNSCSAIPGSTTCTFHLNSVLELSGVGATSCLDFIDSESKVPMFGVTITYTKSIYQVPLKKIYYTSDWKPVTKSQKFCPGAGITEAVKNKDACSFFNNQTCMIDFTAGTACLGFPPGPITANSCVDPVYCYPGLQQCEAVSNKGCGAFDFDEAYLFHRYGFMPVGHVYKVLEPQAVYILPEVELQIRMGNQTHNLTYVFNEAVITSEIMTARIVGSLVGPSDVFGSNKIIIGANPSEISEAYYGHACEQNIPCANGVGDIQANNAGDFSKITVDDTNHAFKFPIGVVTHTVRDGAADFIFPSRGLETNKPILTKLPSLINGQLWTISDETLYINAINSGPLLVQLESASDLVITQTVNTICPEIDPLQNSAFVGCSHCLQGLVVSISAKSSCLAGSVIVELQLTSGQATLVTNTVELFQTSNVIQIRLLPSTEIVEGTLILQGTGSTAHFTFSGLTPEIETITNETDIPVIAPPGTPNDPDIANDSSMSDFWNWFNSLDGWKAGLKWTIVAVVITIIAILLLVICIKVFQVVQPMVYTQISN